MLGDEMCKFSVDNNIEILEIPKGEKELLEVKNYKPTSHLERLFDGKIWVKKSDVERILKQFGRTSSSEDEDVCVKLWICLLFTTFLIPDSNCGFPSWLLCYIDDLDMIPSYN